MICPPKTHGEWTFNDDEKTWRLALNAKDSKGISLYFNQFWIPSSGSLTIYNADTTSIVHNQLMNHFDVYPNPTKGRFNLFSEDHGTVMVYNMLSELVYRIEKRKNSTMIELQKRTPGIYFIHFNNNIKKLILH